MTNAEARARLKRMLDADSEPVLTEADIDDCLSVSVVAEPEGEPPAYDLNRGAAEGWRRKASKLIMAYDFEADGASYDRSQAIAACERMERLYRRRIVGSVRVRGRVARGG